jgi:guanylate kinase
MNKKGMKKDKGKERKGIVLIISAPSGTGKTTLRKELVSIYPDIAFSVSATTRERKEGERDGVDYHFLSREEFLKMIERDELLEWAEVHGHLYGTPKAEFKKALDLGKDVILEIDVSGARKVKEKLPQAVTIFLLPPSYSELLRRVRTRMRENKKEIKIRLTRAEQEIDCFPEYDYIVVNDDFASAKETLTAIVRAERSRTERMEQVARRTLATFPESKA